MLLVLLVLVGVVGLLAVVHWYVWRRLVRDVTVPGGAARRLGTIALVVLPLLSLAALTAGRAGVPFWLQRVVSWPGFLWLALLLYLVLALVVGEAVRPLLRRALDRRAASTPAAPPAPAAPPVTVPPAPAPAAPAPEPPTAPEPPASAGPTAATGPSRRLFVSRVVGGAAAAAALGTVGYGTYGVLRGPRVKRVTVPLAKLPRGVHGYRIAVVSDIHLGPILGRAHTQRIVDAINATQPDLVAVVGDMVDGSVENLGPAAEPLAGLRARDGSFFVTGNHEYFSGAEQWVDHVRELGMRPLRNERVEIAGFDLAGVNDVAGENYGDGPDFAAALGDRDRARAAVLLAHQPVVIHDAVEHGVDLQLSGHTHGGQLWPGNYLAELANPTVAGLERYGDTQLYVSRGAGAWGPPVRVGAPSDITLVELASKRA
ncbi:metallophosphoesterase [Streptomyces ficellus]|uniref:Metallophosphoesterase n=1 Tax=Streptomyces ficellus TaxID=1977088 RepID=A0A6I6F5K8_9ACTN|nr:metallophosphoesterase [Streptomyces ficellus]QGV78940.1 metallophosphoesterase [Streptomyces ficellus]